MQTDTCSVVHRAIAACTTRTRACTPYNSIVDIGGTAQSECVYSHVRRKIVRVGRCDVISVAAVTSQKVDSVAVGGSLY